MHTTSAPDSDSCIGGIVTGQGYAVNIWNVFEMRGNANNTTINCGGGILSNNTIIQYCQQHNGLRSD